MKPILLLPLMVISMHLRAQTWNLVWSDEFNGTQLDSSFWNHDNGTGSQYGLGGWGGNELQYYQTQNAVVNNGTLKLIAKQEPAGIPSSNGTKYYSSAKVTTQNKFEFRYGKIQDRIKTLEGQGFWPAFWMLPKGTNNLQFPGLNCWPKDGEIDIMEQWASDGPTNSTTGAAHVGTNCVGPSFYQVWNANLANNGSYAANFHTYGLEWKRDTLSWFVDSVKQLSVSPSDYPNGNWPFNANNWYLQLNLAITSSGPNANTFFPNQIEIDYVRVYQVDPVLVGCTDSLAVNYKSTATTDDGSCRYLVDFALDLNCTGIHPQAVHIASSSIAWNCDRYTLSDTDNDGVWTQQFEMPKGQFEYIYCTDGWSATEGPGLIAAMVNGATCAPITDYVSYANRVLNVTSATSVYDTWGRCEALVYGCTNPASPLFNPLATCDDGSCFAAAIDPLATNGLTLFPNPAHGNLNVKWKTDQAGRVDFAWVNMLGAEVASQKVTANVGENEVLLSLEGLPAGVYLLRVSTPQGHDHRQVVVY